MSQLIKDGAASRSVFVIGLMTNLNGESQTLSVAVRVANLVTDICNILHVAFERSRPRATHVALDEASAAAAALSSLLSACLPALTKTLTLTGSGTLSRSVGVGAAASFSGHSVCRSHGARLLSLLSSPLPLPLSCRFTCRIFQARDSVCGRLRASAVCFCLWHRSLGLRLANGKREIYTIYMRAIFATDR